MKYSKQVKTLLLGQILSLLISGTGVSSQMLALDGVRFQMFFVVFCLNYNLRKPHNSPID